MTPPIHGPRRQESDRFLNEVFSAASLPLIRIPAKGSYSAEEIRGYLSGVPLSAPAPARTTPSEAANPPNCPKCGIPMVVRQASAGEHKGERFYGCRNFPQCRQVVPIDR